MSKSVPEDITGATEEAFKLVMDYVLTGYKYMSHQERDLIGGNIINHLLDLPSKEKIGRKHDPKISRISKCLLDIMKARLALNHHIVLVSSNPYKKKIPDTDYIELLANSFYETAYLVHERLRSILNILKRQKGAATNAKLISDKILLNPKRSKQDEPSIFDLALAERGFHIHASSAAWPGIDRLSRLSLYAEIDAPPLTGIAKSFIRSQLGKCRRENKKNFQNVITLVKFGCDAFFREIMIDLQVIYQAGMEQQKRSLGTKVE